MRHCALKTISPAVRDVPLSALEHQKNLYLFVGPLSLETTLVAANYASKTGSNLAITNNCLGAELYPQDQELQALNRQIFIAAGTQWSQCIGDISEELSASRIESNVMLSSLSDWALQLVQERSQYALQSVTLAGSELAQTLPFWWRVAEKLGMNFSVSLVLPESMDVQERIALEYDMIPEHTLLLTAARITSLTDFFSKKSDEALKLTVLGAEDIQRALPTEDVLPAGTYLGPTVTDVTVLREKMRGRQSYEMDFLSQHQVLLSDVLHTATSPCDALSAGAWGAIHRLFLAHCTGSADKSNPHIARLLTADRAIRDRTYRHQQSTAVLELKTITRRLADIEKSVVWRITAPLRVLPKKPLTLLTSLSPEKMLGVIWNGLPFSSDVRDKVKHYIFSHFFIGPMRRQKIYQDWLNWTASRHSVQPSSAQKWPIKKITDALPLTVAGRHIECLSLADCSDPFKSEDSVKPIAFYLPQFHQIPENDTWWGEGFTEWTNTRASKSAHRIRTAPKTPHESLGYYDLSNPKVMREQATQAEAFGLQGFCFYFYWFGGKTLLELPVQNYFANDDIKFPFMLCWANENWTRTWDGLDQEVLISQNYSAQDDIDFISYVSKYLMAPTYIRIDNKPVLMVYRAEQLPNAHATAKRWREWCQSNGVGDIYLMGCWSFARYDPREIGFDAALITAPVGENVPSIEAPEFCEDTFSGALHDWLSVARRSESYHLISSDFDLYFSVNPAWDNSPRRGANASVLCGNHPTEYESWLINAIEASRLRAKGKDKSAVFINAWNEWAEGAVLEPAADSGFSYLEATKSAVRATSFKDFGNEVAKSKQFTEQCENTRRVVVIHVFYLEEFSQILDSLSALRQDCPLVVTCPRDLCEPVQSLLRQRLFEFLILSVPNKGRDILPFVFLGKEYDFFGADWILKLHTKKSPHREDGSAWLSSFLSALTQIAANPQGTAWSDNSIGLMAPEQNIVPLDYYWGNNAERVMLLMESNLHQQDLEKLIASSSYVAGSMFLMARPVMNKVVELPVSPASFEEEAGQIDGTTAHALERIFGVLAHAQNLSILPVEGVSAELPFEFANPTGRDGAAKELPQ